VVTMSVAPQVTTADVWRHLAKTSFAVISQVTSSGEPRSSGVLYDVGNGRLHVVVASDSWKARHLTADGRVAVTVPVHRGGLLALVASIPPATISFHGHATVHPAGTLLDRMARTVPPERRTSASIVEIAPEGEFLLYGIGVPLSRMRDPSASRARVPVSGE
jgi:pyridoxamine 5'-phosphate oxidase-like protein